MDISKQVAELEARCKAAEKLRDEWTEAFHNAERIADQLRTQLARRRDMTLTAERLERLTDIIMAWVDVPYKILVTDDQMRAEIRDLLERWSREGKADYTPLQERINQKADEVEGKVEPATERSCTCPNPSPHKGTCIKPPAPDLAALERAALYALSTLEKANTITFRNILDDIRALWLADIDAKLAARKE